MTPDNAPRWPTRWQRLAAASVRAFHGYASWLIGITWRRFIVLSVLLLIVTGLLQNIPPFSWTYTSTLNLPTELPTIVIDAPPAPPARPASPASPAPATAASAPGRAAPAGIRIETPPKGDKPGVNITIDERGVRIGPGANAAPSAASATPGAASAPSPASPEPVINIRLPASTSDAVRQAVEEARQTIEDAMRDAHDEAEAARAEAQAAREAGRSVAADAQREAARTVADARRAARRKATTVYSVGEFLPSLAMLWIVASLIIKISYKRQVQAQAQAAQAVETAESEALKRQVVEARMAAMQAQVEPHFLFNTLASIDHLIEVDPKRASQMQKNLIALLRASMPTMREANDGGAGLGKSRDLGRELMVIRPYLEILKVRMEERLATEIDVPDGLLSAEIPPMMVQTLVENAIKHGLEPKPEGGRLTLKAEIVHGKLAVSVADTGLGFGRAASSGTTAGTGVGLANIRERLQLRYGARASLTITENPGGGTRVVLAVPYKPVEAAGLA